MGIASGLSLNGTISVISTGFGNLIAGIGLSIIFGIMIGTLLARCGEARKIAVTFTGVVPTRYVSYALTLSGGMGISHINDSGFWVVTEFTCLEVTGGLKTYTLGEAVLSVFGLVGAVSVTLLS